MADMEAVRVKAVVPTGMAAVVMVEVAQEAEARVACGAARLVAGTGAAEMEVADWGLVIVAVSSAAKQDTVVFAVAEVAQRAGEEHPGALAAAV